MDLEKNTFLGNQLGIKSIPTFLFIHNGQVVKKMTGADKNGLTANVRWLISTYNLGPGTPINPVIAQAIQPAQPKQLEVYSEKSEPFYFDTDKWDLPIKKLKEHGTKTGLLSQPEHKDVEKGLVLQFGNVEQESKVAVINFALKTAPVDDVDTLVPYLDFFRICLMRDELTK